MENKYLKPGKHVDVVVSYQAIFTAACAGIELHKRNPQSHGFELIKTLDENMPHLVAEDGDYRLVNSSNCACSVQVVMVDAPTNPCPEPEPVCPCPEPEPECPEPAPECPEPEPEPECPEKDKGDVWQLLLVEHCPEPEPECPEPEPECPAPEPECPKPQPPCPSMGGNTLQIPTNLLEAIACALASKTYTVKPDFAPLLAGLGLLTQQIVASLETPIQNSFSFAITNQPEGVAGVSFIDVHNNDGMVWHIPFDVSEHPRVVAGEVAGYASVSTAGVVSVSMTDADGAMAPSITMDIGGLIASGNAAFIPAGDYTLSYEGDSNAWQVTNVSSGAVNGLAPDANGNLALS